MASWRSEYLLRTRLLRCVGRGKPAASSSSSASSRTPPSGPPSGKKSTAVLTYNSRLPWPVTNLHALFSVGRKGPKVLHGTCALGMGTVSDPFTGKVEKAGLDDPVSFAQLDDMFPNYGAGSGPAAVPNVLDVSLNYGLLGGQGFPGGRVFFRPAGDVRGRYLGHNAAAIDATPELPQIPELTEAASSVWISKTECVPSTTCGVIGMLAGSTLGLVTAFALGLDSTGPRYSPGDMTARWAVSPGVPIVEIKVDDNYSLRRRSMKRVWAVVLNALGEVFYLSDAPTPPEKINRQHLIKEAWHTGHSVCWNLIESTRRQTRPDKLDMDGISSAYSPPLKAIHRTREQMVAGARETDRYLRHPPSHFREVCQGWDMRRRLQVDFASDGESVFVISCGLMPGALSGIRKHSRLCEIAGGGPSAGDNASPADQPIINTSMLGGDASPPTAEPAVPGVRHGLALGRVESSPIPTNPYEARVGSGWRVADLVLPPKHAQAAITATCVDLSTFAVTTSFEDPLHTSEYHDAMSNKSAGTPAPRHVAGEIPGRRSRLMAVGTSTGAVLVWDMRDGADTIRPVRIIQTESPAVSSVALSSLYLVHGGSDGLVQAWDPLASSLEPIRTLSARASRRIPRHLVNMNPALQNADFTSVGDIFLDPDPTMLRGVSSFGTFVRFWSYNSLGHSPGRKRRNRHLDASSRAAASRRMATAVSSYIAAEEAELRHETEHRAREDAHLRRRFGVGISDLTEEEAIRYAQMISEESFRLDEQRRTLSASDPGSSGDGGETSSSAGSNLSSHDALEPPALYSASPSSVSLPPLPEIVGEDAEFKEQIQRALRLSLLEGEADASPPTQDTTRF